MKIFSFFFLVLAVAACSQPKRPAGVPPRSPTGSSNQATTVSEKSSEPVCNPITANQVNQLYTLLTEAATWQTVDQFGEFNKILECNCDQAFNALTPLSYERGANLMKGLKANWIYIASNSNVKKLALKLAKTRINQWAPFCPKTEAYGHSTEEIFTPILSMFKRLNLKWDHSSISETLGVLNVLKANEQAAMLYTEMGPVNRQMIIENGNHSIMLLDDVAELPQLLADASDKYSGMSAMTPLAQRRLVEIAKQVAAAAQKASRSIRSIVTTVTMTPTNSVSTFKAYELTQEVDQLITEYRAILNAEFIIPSALKAHQFDTKATVISIVHELSEIYDIAGGDGDPDAVYTFNAVIQCR